MTSPLQPPTPNKTYRVYAWVFWENSEGPHETLMNTALVRSFDMAVIIEALDREWRKIEEDWSVPEPHYANPITMHLDYSGEGEDRVLVFEHPRFDRVLPQ